MSRSDGRRSRLECGDRVRVCWRIWPAQRGNGMARPKKPIANMVPAGGPGYAGFLAGVALLLDLGRRTASQAVNAVLAATYWEVGRRIVEFDQGGEARAEYGEGLLARLATDLTARHGRGFSERNLRQMRAFFLGWEIR